MTYIEYLNDFNRWIEEDSPTDKVIILYYAMLNMFNDRRWQRWARVDTQQLMAMVRTTSNNTAYRARDALVKAGFLAYKPGRKGRSSEYSLLKYCPKNCTENGTECGTENGTECGTENGTPNKTKTKTKKDVVVEVVGAREDADDGLGRVMRLYMDQVQAMPSSTCVDFLKGYTEELGADVVCNAIERAVDDNKRSWSYIHAILKRYSAQGLTSLAAVQRADADFQQARERSGARAAAPLGQQRCYTGNRSGRMDYITESLRKDLEHDGNGYQSDAVGDGKPLVQLPPSRQSG